MAFRAGRLVEAIRSWEGLIRSDPSLAEALAEAYFRRALAYAAQPDQQLADLRRAVELVPDDARYQYHLALALHRRGDLAGALQAYQAALARDPKRRGAAFTAAVAALEANPRAELNWLSGLAEQDRDTLALLGTLLRSEPVAIRNGSASPKPPITPRPDSGLALFRVGSDTLWQGLALLASGQARAACEMLASGARLRLPRRAEAVRRYYAGVAAAQMGDLETAAAEWQQARTAGLDTSWLSGNLAVVYGEQALALAKAGDWPAALDAAQKGLSASPGNAMLTEIAVTSLDRKAQAAATQGDWETATGFWVQAREFLSQATGIGSPRPILQNLAIAYENLEQWGEAAEAWRAVLRTRPRKKTQDGLADAQWAWVRKRVIEDYKRAGRPDQAVTIFRQAIKADPNDLDARLELVEALLANDQEIAARNELERILEHQPNHVEALLRLAELHMERGEWYAGEGLLRRALEQAPESEVVRQQMKRCLVERGRNHHRNGWLGEARKAFEEALTYVPNDYNIYIDLGRVDLDSDRFDDACEVFERAFALAPNNLDVYAQIFGCWTIEQDMEEARKVIARAKTHAQPTPEFYIHAGLDCLNRSAPPLPPGLFGRLQPRPEPSDPWHDFGIELLESAVALRPDDVGVYQHIVSDLIAVELCFRPDVALQYAERLVELAPDEPLALFKLGAVQVLNGQIPAAKEVLRRGAQLAHRQGDRELERMMNTARQRLSDPMFPIMFMMRFLQGTHDHDEL